MGNESLLRSIACRIADADSIKNTNAIEVVSLDMEDDREATFHGAVEKACNLLGKLDAFVNFYAYEGMSNWVLLSIFIGCDQLRNATCYWFIVT